MDNTKKEFFCTYYGNTCDVKKTCADECSTVCHLCNSKKVVSYKKAYTISFDDESFYIGDIILKRTNHVDEELI